MSKGFGLCGHKGSFNTNVKLGNWVEDEYGRYLATIPDRGQHLPVNSESRSAYIHPNAMSDNAGGICEEVSLENREGLSADMLFSHPLVRTDKMAINSSKIGSKDPNSTQVIQERASKLQQEKNYRPISEAHASSQNVPQIEFKLNDKDAEALPVFTRRKMKYHNSVFHI